MRFCQKGSQTNENYSRDNLMRGIFFRFWSGYENWIFKREGVINTGELVYLQKKTLERHEHV